MDVLHLDEQSPNGFKEIKEDAMIIGCHIIPESEINEFLKFYNLDW
jgi:hypothetical protein